MKRGFVLFVASILIFTFSQNAFCQNVDPKKQANKLITAIQNDDFQTIFNMSYGYILHANAIKAETPAFLFQKKLNEYYEKSQKEFYEGDTLVRYFPKNCNWKIIEVKKTKERLVFTKGLTDVYLVYASVTYGDIASSPVEISSPIKETVVELQFLPKNGMFVVHKLISDANVLWSLPVRISNAKYEYSTYNGSYPALLISFSIDGGNSKWIGGKAPYQYKVFINNMDVESFVSKHKGYSHYFEISTIQQSVTQKNFMLILDNRDRSVPDLRNEDEIRASFRWPKDFSSPVNVKIQVIDSSNPVKSDSCELNIEALAASEESVEDTAQGAVNKLKGIMGF